MNPSFQADIHPAALAEALVARDWYQERSPRAAVAFLAELDHAVNQVLSSPNRWPRFEEDTRRYIFPRFPFVLIYRVREASVQVIAIAHQRRKPGYWASRE